MTDRAKFFEWTGPRLKLLPVLLVLALGFAVLGGSGFATKALVGAVAPGSRWPQWLAITVAEAFELLLALFGIAVASRFVPRADWGLRAPQARGYVRLAIWWGLAFGLIMLIADHWPALIAMHAPPVPETATTVNVAGWLGFELLWVGICEETLFRGFLLGLLTALSPSRVRLGGIEVSTAGVTLALLFALAHSGNFATRPFAEAFAQQLYAFALGVLYAWLREQSRSLVPAMIAHSLGDFVETGLVFLLAGVMGA
jgi:membrane protease YdiL (CAAX protease family)